MITVTIGKIFELIYNILSEVMKFIYNADLTNLIIGAAIISVLMFVAFIVADFIQERNDK